MFFGLAMRLPAYRGVLRQRLAAEQENSGSYPAARGPVRTPARYAAGSPMRNNARAAATAPPATRQALTALNAQLGQTWFTHRTVQPGSAG